MNPAPGFLNRADMEKAAKALGEKWHTEEEAAWEPMLSPSRISCCCEIGGDRRELDFLMVVLHYFSIYAR